MRLASRQLVLKHLKEMFPDPAVAQQVLETLDSYGKGGHEPAAEAVHLAILALSNGNLWRVRELVQVARHDFRDVLYPAQMLAGWGAMLS
jgi:hypothetical protein